jgi:hypothetical protein
VKHDGAPDHPNYLVCHDPVGTPCNFTSNFAAWDGITIWWDAPGDHSGRARYTVFSVTDTRIVLNEWIWGHAPISNGTNLSYSKTPNMGWWSGTSGLSTSYNFYDAVQSMYSLYYSTGDDAYQTMARNLADLWWINFLDHGYNVNAQSRDVALGGMILRALDGRPEMWPGILAAADLQYQAWINSKLPGSYACVDCREQGYAAYDVVLIAGTHPDEATRAAYLGKANAAALYFSNVSTIDGWWGEDFGALSWGWPNGYTGLGTSPWRTVAIPLRGFVKLHQLTHDPTLFSMIQRAVDFDIAHRDVDCKGYYYSVMYKSQQTWESLPPGKVDATNGSTTITCTAGQSCSFTQGTNYFRCNGTDTINIPVNTAQGLRTYGYVVSSCQSDTSLTIATPYEQDTASGLSFTRGALNTPTCAWGGHDCEGGGCTDVPSSTSARELAAIDIANIGYVYAQTGISSYKSAGDAQFAASFGSTGGGPGTDGGSGELYDTTHVGKNLGFNTGFGAAQTYLAYRLMGSQPPGMRTRGEKTRSAKIQ